MLLFLGTYKEGENLKEGDYKYKDGISYKGIQTADAPVLYQRTYIQKRKRWKKKQVHHMNFLLRKM